VSSDYVFFVKTFVYIVKYCIYIVHVKDGPLKGLEGLIANVNMHTRRAKIKLNFMGEPRTIEVGIEMLGAK
jgi:hypothetical protein